MTSMGTQTEVYNCRKEAKLDIDSHHLISSALWNVSYIIFHKILQINSVQNQPVQLTAVSSKCFIYLVDHQACGYVMLPLMVFLFMCHT